METAVLSVTFTLLGDLPALAGPVATTELTRQLREPASAKDCLEAVGIPHTEVDLLRLDTGPVGFDYLVQPGDRIEVHPVPPAREPAPPGDAARLQPRPLEQDRFVCDQHLGKLARLLRILGFDTLYQRDWREAEICRRAVADQRAILTCSRALLKRKQVTVGRLIRSRHADRQLQEVVQRFGLAARVSLFGRCSLCNGELTEVPKQRVAGRVPAQTWLWLDRYFLCRGCDQLYWEGTHVTRLRERIAAILENE
jgi:uncharacterized protein with PIN domain